MSAVTPIKDFISSFMLLELLKAETVHDEEGRVMEQVAVFIVITLQPGIGDRGVSHRD